LVRLIEDLSLSQEVVVAEKEANQRIIWDYQENGLYTIPSSVVPFLLSGKSRKWFYTMMKEPFKARNVREDETIHDFVARRFDENIATNLIGSIVVGIYGGSSKKLSIKSCFPRIYNYEIQRGSVIKGLVREPSSYYDSELCKFIKSSGRTFSLKNGIETLPVSIFNRHKDSIRTNSKVEKILIKNDKIILQVNENSIQKEYIVDRVISCIPSFELAKLLPNDDLSNILNQIPFIDMASINLSFKNKILPTNGFGYLVPPIANEPILGVSFESCIFKHNSLNNETILTIMMGGDSDNNEISKTILNLIQNQNKSEIEKRGIEALKRHLKIKEDPVSINTIFNIKAIPQYTLGHHQRIKDLETMIKNRYQNKIMLLGQSYYGVGINACIENTIDKLTNID